jgi:hypothetical protein
MPESPTPPPVDDAIKDELKSNIIKKEVSESDYYDDDVEMDYEIEEKNF